MAWIRKNGESNMSIKQSIALFLAVFLTGWPVYGEPREIDFEAEFLKSLDTIDKQAEQIKALEAELKDARKDGAVDELDSKIKGTLLDRERQDHTQTKGELKDSTKERDVLLWNIPAPGLGWALAGMRTRAQIYGSGFILGLGYWAYHLEQARQLEQAKFRFSNTTNLAGFVSGRTGNLTPLFAAWSVANQFPHKERRAFERGSTGLGFALAFWAVSIWDSATVNITTDSRSLEMSLNVRL